LERIDIDKYNIAIGLINDIVEIYGMKVVIICNSEVLGEKFIYDILRSKLNCIEYRKIVLPEVRISVIDNCIKNKILIDDGKQEIIKGFLNENIKYNIDNILFERQFRNLRLYGNLLEAFIITADLFDKKDLTKEFMNSLFNSIMITHIVFYNKAFNKLSVFPSGANIEFLMKLFYGGSSILIRTNQRINDIKWIDIKVSGYWIFNLSQPYEIGNIVAGSYLSALSGLTGLKAVSSVPSLTVDMVGALLSVPATEFGKYGDKLLMIQSQFGELDFVTGYFLLIPELDSYDKILSSLGM